MRSTIFIAVVAAGLAALPAPAAAQETVVIRGGAPIEGLDGLRALEGLKGLDGLQGLAGLKGLEGLEGLRGLAGLQGLRGLSALQGLSGLSRLQALGATVRVDGDAVLIDDDLDALPPALRVTGQETPADSLYRAAREALNRGDYRSAATMFSRLASRYPESSHAGDALYWRAFALYRVGGTSELKRAKESLKAQKEKYPKARTLDDAETLSVRIDGALARQGDAQSAERVTRGADSAARAQCGSSEDADMREAALSALQQMDSERAIPILKQVLAKRDACSAKLRRTAMFLLSQKRTSETEQLMLDAARQDPDREVRKQAVFWLGQVHSERAVSALDSIARGNGDRELREGAIFALSQQGGSGRANATLREIAGDTAQALDLREKAVFWLGQQRSQENATFLRGLFDRTRSDDLRSKILFSLSQQRGQGNEEWLMQVAGSPKYSIEVRKQAIFSISQAGGPVAPLVGLYDRLTERQLREQTIFALSQRNDERAAMDKLFEIAKGDKDPEMRKKAIFWLGQSRDPRVQQLLLDIING